jgi:hypothetical protein
MTSANINVVVQKGQMVQPMSKDKFLVMCMALPDGDPLSADEIANMWKEVTANSPEVEQHRLKCTVPANITTAIINNADIITGMTWQNLDRDSKWKNCLLVVVLHGKCFVLASSDKSVPINSPPF